MNNKLQRYYKAFTSLRQIYEQIIIIHHIIHCKNIYGGLSMKKSSTKILSLLAVFLLLTSIFAGCKKSSSTLTKVKLDEVTRSIFYAPMYAAVNQGFFKEEGIDLEITTGQGADKTMQQLLSGSVDVAFSGPEQVLYIHNQKRDDLPILFAQLTQTDGSFLVSRKEDKNFKWESLRGKTVIGGRPGGVPQMALEYVLRNHGIDPNKDLNMITNIAFAAVPGAFKGGTGEYAAIFEPTASMFEQEKAGYIVASVGKSAGVMPYTCFYTTKSFMDKNSDLIQRFTRAIYKGQLWVNKTKDDEVAKSIKSFFPGTDEALIAKVVKNYRDINAFSPTPIMKEEDMVRLMNIIQSYKADLLKERPAFNSLVDNKFAEKAIKEVK
jgi:NitT/TauT family transport system substrate-binding protein